METFSRLLALCVGVPSVTGGFPSQTPMMQNFDVLFIWTNSWANNQDTGDLIYHHTNNDVTDIYHKDTCGPFYKQELASPTFNIILWIMDKKLNTQISWDVITYPCPYINGGLS